MLSAIGFYSYIQSNLLEAVCYLGLIVIQLDNIGILISQNLRYLQQLARLIRQQYGEAEDAAAGHHSLINQRRNGGNINITTADDSYYLLALKWQLV